MILYLTISLLAYRKGLRFKPSFCCCPRMLTLKRHCIGLLATLCCLYILYYAIFLLQLLGGWNTAFSNALEHSQVVNELGKSYQSDYESFFTIYSTVQHSGVNSMIKHWTRSKYRPNIFLVHHFRTSDAASVSILANDGRLIRSLTLAFQGSPTYFGRIFFRLQIIKSNNNFFMKFL